MLRKAIISRIHFEDSNSTVKSGIATLFRIQVKLETDPIPNIEAVSDHEETTTLPDPTSTSFHFQTLLKNCPINNWSF